MSVNVEVGCASLWQKILGSVRLPSRRQLPVSDAPRAPHGRPIHMDEASDAPERVAYFLCHVVPLIFVYVVLGELGYIDTVGA